MAFDSVFDSNRTAITLAHIEQATEKINALPSQNLSISVFRDMLTGFKKLMYFVELQYSENALEAALKWCQLFLKLQSSIHPKNEGLRQQFEKIVPPVVTYIIGFLQVKAQRMPTYHYQLLDITQTLLTNVKLSTLEKLANFAPGIIACLWVPIDFVGDFNTQMLALRIFAKILKCVDGRKQQKEIEKIHCLRNSITRKDFFQTKLNREIPVLDYHEGLFENVSNRKNFFQTKLSRAIAVADYHEGLFENVARNLLNNYNMNLAENVLVYSCRCKTLHIGEQFEFFKLQNADHFWVDFNYCPRSVSFNGRYESKHYNQFVNVSVVCFIQHMRLSQQLLLIKINPPANFSVKNPDLVELEQISSLTIKLPDAEFAHLKENNFLAQYYNSPEEENDNPTMSEPPAVPIATKDPDINLPQVENDESNSYSATTSDNFERSYGILVGQSGGNQDSSKDALFKEKTSTQSTAEHTRTQLKNTVFKRPSICIYKKSIRKAKTVANMKLFKSPNIVNNSINLLPFQSHEQESPRTSRISNNSSTLLRGKHPIRELLVAKRFFKTTSPRNWNQDINTFFTTRKMRKTNSSKTKITLPSKPKQIIRVKPMNHLDISEFDFEEDSSVEQPNIRNKIINITNILNGGHECSAVYNEMHGRTEVHSISHENERIETPLEIENLENIPLATANDMYDLVDESDAEPCQSYRNFKTRRITETKCAEKTKGMRKRTQAKRVVRAKRAKKDRTEGAVATLPAEKTTTRRSRKTKKPKTNQSKSKTTKIPNTTQNEPPIENTIDLTTTGENRTIYSTDIEIDVTCSEIPQAIQKSTANCHVKNGKQAIFKLCAEKDVDFPLNGDWLNEEELIRNDQTKIIQKESSVDIETQPKLVSKTNAGLSAEYQNENSGGSGSVAKNLQSTIDNSMPSNDGQFFMEIQECRNVSRRTLESFSPVVFSGDILSENGAGHNVTKQNACIQENNQEAELHSDEPLRKKPRIQTKITKDVASNEAMSASMYSVEACIHHARSDDDCSSSDSEFDEEHTSIVESNITKSMSVDDISTTTITTTATSIRTRLISRDIQQNSSLSAVMQSVADASHFPIRGSSGERNDLSLISSSLSQESTDIVNTYQHNLADEFDELLKQTKNRCLGGFLAKINDVTKLILNASEKERAELQECEENISRLVCKLDGQYNAYNKKFEQFKCFRKNVENMLDALSSVNVFDDVDREFDQLQKDVELSSKAKSAKQWQEFVRKSTENLIKSMTELSNI